MKFGKYYVFCAQNSEDAEGLSKALYESYSKFKENFTNYTKNGIFSNVEKIQMKLAFKTDIGKTCLATVTKDKIYCNDDNSAVVELDKIQAAAKNDTKVPGDYKQLDI